MSQPDTASTVASDAPLLAPAHTAAPATIAPLRWSFVLPRWLRAVLMAALFFFFFLGSPLIALVVFPVLRLTAGPRFRDRSTDLLRRAMHFIAHTARSLGIVGLDLPPLPPSVDPRKPYVLISNHPTFIDMIVLLGSFPGLTCVTNGRWWKHWALGRLLRATNYLPGPGSGLPESDAMLDTMVAHLEAGHPLLVFPEGQRSLKEKLRRFRRGAVEAAVRAGVPLVPVFLAIDQPYLTKSVSIWSAPKTPPTYRFEWFDVVHPKAWDNDGKRIQKHIETIYAARFAEQRARHEALPG